MKLGLEFNMAAILVYHRFLNHQSLLCNPKSAIGCNAIHTDCLPLTYYQPGRDVDLASITPNPHGDTSA